MSRKGTPPRPSLAQRFALILLSNNLVTVSTFVFICCWTAEFSFLDDNSFDGSQSFGGGNGHSLFADSDDEGGAAFFYRIAELHDLQYSLTHGFAPSTD
jgi:hypothetical protein